MLKNQNIICISSIDWDFIWQGHQEIMSVLAKNGNRVLFIENTGVRVPGLRDISRIRDRIKNWFKGVKGIRKEADNLYVFSPLILPFPYSRFARWINKHLILSILDRWIKVMDFSDPIVWTFLPTPLSLDIADSISKKLFIYYCIDNFSVSSVSAKQIKYSEKKVLKKSDVVFVTSKALHDYCSQHNNKTYYFPFGVNFSEFKNIDLRDISMPPELNGISHPIIGYVGGIHKWVDQNLIKGLAEAHPEYSFVFVGPVQTNVSLISKLRNVHFLGKKEHKDVPLFVKYFDICVIPYLITEYTNNVYPTKLNEYLSMGKPVISTKLPEVITFVEQYGNIAYTASGAHDFSARINDALAEDKELLRKKRADAAFENSWEMRIEKMSKLVETEIERKKTNLEAKWKETLINFYRVARKRTLRIIALFVFLYIVIFKTSFIWVLASPLKIENSPQKADVILVFGGGVGETGSPGKSTIERARYAVELYKKGYADKIIFSSGYSYKYNDAENMKLFANSMGVPEKSIILEEKANSAYENVMFSKKILDENKWHSVLLVSSPYNMRRAELVINKHYKDIKVYYIPIENSQFYDKALGSRIDQTRAIMHEYFGIIYYFTKGLI